jgi:hypothetical protein
LGCSHPSEEKTRGSVIDDENSTSNYSSSTENSDNTHQQEVEKAAQITVKTLFDAWEKLDLEQYLSVWSSNAIKYNGAKKETFQQLKTKRERLFPRLDRVSVDEYSIQDMEVMNKQAMVTVKYSMTFWFTNGKVVKENDITEVYSLVYDDVKEAWFIKENRDYIK